MFNNAQLIFYFSQAIFPPKLSQAIFEYSQVNKIIIPTIAQTYKKL